MPICPLLRARDGHVPWWQRGRGMSRGGGGRSVRPGPAAGRGGRDFLGRDHEGQRNGDVGAAGADGALGLAPPHQLAKRIREASLDPVPDHHAGPKRGSGKELLRRGRWRSHHLILGPDNGTAGTCVTPG